MKFVRYTRRSKLTISVQTSGRTTLLARSVFAMFDMSPRFMFICILTYNCVGIPVSCSVNIKTVIKIKLYILFLCKVLHYGNLYYYIHCSEINKNSNSNTVLVYNNYYDIAGFFFPGVLPDWRGSKSRVVFDRGSSPRWRPRATGRPCKNEDTTTRSENLKRSNH